jgi:putative SOS response-associated peptidase YedK
MCGRFALYAPHSKIHDYFDADIEGLEFSPRYNIAPMQLAPVIRQRPSGERVAHLLRWGLIPSWSKDASIATKLINARCETIAEKPSFRPAYKSRRCILPASGFYEWQKIQGGKQPYLILPVGDELFGFAGLWERWTQPDGVPLDTFTVITTEANEAMAPVHDRMPVILAHENFGAWLARDSEVGILQSLLRPCAPERARMHPVSRAVGAVANDNATLIEPVVLA